VPAAVVSGRRSGPGRSKPTSDKIDNFTSGPMAPPCNGGSAGFASTLPGKSSSPGLEFSPQDRLPVAIAPVGGEFACLTLDQAVAPVCFGF
jgi:hypothetical protein